MNLAAIITEAVRCPVEKLLSKICKIHKKKTTIKSILDNVDCLHLYQKKILNTCG